MEHDRIEGSAKEKEGRLTDDELREQQGRAQEQWGETKEKAEQGWERTKEEVRSRK